MKFIISHDTSATVNDVSIRMYLDGTIIINWGDNTEPEVVKCIDKGFGYAITVHHRYNTSEIYSCIEIKSHGISTICSLEGYVETEKDTGFKSTNPAIKATNGYVYGEIIADDDIAIGSYAFYGCMGIHSVIAANLKVAKYAFASSSIEVADIRLADVINQGLFKNCYKLTTVYMTYVTHISKEAFMGCTNLKNIFNNKDLRSSVIDTDTIDPFAFTDTKLQNVSINCKHIMPYAFYNNDRLTSIKLSGIRTINSNAFDSNTLVDTIYIDNTDEFISGDNNFINTWKENTLLKFVVHGTDDIDKLQKQLFDKIKKDSYYIEVQ